MEWLAKNTTEKGGAALVGRGRGEGRCLGHLESADGKENRAVAAIGKGKGKNAHFGRRDPFISLQPASL